MGWGVPWLHAAVLGKEEGRKREEGTDSVHTDNLLTVEGRPAGKRTTSL